MDNGLVDRATAERFYAGLLDIHRRLEAELWRLPRRTRVRIWLLYHFGWG
jgi:hypothetical protein